MSAVSTGSNRSSLYPVHSTRFMHMSPNTTYSPRAIHLQLCGSQWRHLDDCVPVSESSV